MYDILNCDWCVVDDEGGFVGCFIFYGSGWGFMDWEGYKEVLELDVDVDLLFVVIENGIEVLEVFDCYYGEFIVFIC